MLHTCWDDECPLCDSSPWLWSTVTVVGIYGGWKTGFMSSQHYFLFTNGRWSCFVFWGVSVTSAGLRRMGRAWEIWASSCGSIPLPAMALYIAMVCGASHPYWALPGFVGLWRQVQNFWLCPTSLMAVLCFKLHSHIYQSLTWWGREKGDAFS